jgi:hypothetical protein
LVAQPRISLVGNCRSHCSLIKRPCHCVEREQGRAGETFAQSRVIELRDNPAIG